MLTLIGLVRVNQILGTEVALGSTAIEKLLASCGVKPIGKDGQDRLQWSLDQVQEAKAKLAQVKSRAPAPPTVDLGPLTEALASLQKTVLLQSGEFYAAQTKQRAGIKEEMERLTAELTRVTGKLMGAASGIDEQRKKELSFLQERVKHGVAEALALWKPPVSTAPEVDWSAVLEPVLAKALDGRFKAFRTQIDSAMESVDQRVASILTAVQGHHRIAVEIKARMDEVLRASNSAVSNVYTSQKATREELGKGLTRLENAIDGLADHVKVLLERINTAISDFSVVIRRLDAHMAISIEKGVADALHKSESSDPPAG